MRACWPFDVIKHCPLKEAHIIHYTYGQDVNLAASVAPMSGGNQAAHCSIRPGSMTVGLSAGKIYTGGTGLLALG